MKKRIKERITTWNANLPDLSHVKNRKIGVGRFKNGNWLIRASSNGYKSKMILTDDTLSCIIDTIVKIKLGVLKEQEET
jgi:hypothetical protein